jgi:hypothetical protein
MTTVTATPRNTVDSRIARTYRGNDRCLLIAKLGWAIFPAEFESRKVSAQANESESLNFNNHRRTAVFGAGAPTQ